MDEMPRREGEHSWCQNLGKDALLSLGGLKFSKILFLLCHFWVVQNFHHFGGLTNPSYFCYSISVSKKYELSNQTCK